MWTIKKVKASSIVETFTLSVELCDHSPSLRFQPLPLLPSFLLLSLPPLLVYLIGVNDFYSTHYETFHLLN